MIEWARYAIPVVMQVLAVLVFGAFGLWMVFRDWGGR